MISVLVPSRGRPELLRASLESLGEGDFEILVHLDDDDPELSEYLSIPTTYTIIGKRYGYKGLHHYINTLCRVAYGDWLMLWNDDAVMDTPGWADKLHQPTKPEVINFDHQDDQNLFPLVSRQMYEAMGHFSLSTHNDSWVQDIANEVGIHTYIPGVRVIHLRDGLDDETKRESQSAYATTSPEYNTLASFRKQDANKIRRLL